MTAKIAIIEDDQAISQMYRFKLESSGYIVETAANGKLGLELIEKMKPDLLLLDIRMPEMGGDEMLKKLREFDWGADIRVVILTNISKDEAPHSLRFLSVDRYIVKAHYTPKEVLEVVGEVLQIA
jgi:DNA-binding response OmpR family regulator